MNTDFVFSALPPSLARSARSGSSCSRVAWRTRLPQLLLLAFVGATPAFPAPVLMISVDGMKPEYALDADAHGLKIPFLRSLMRDGAYARGVIGVWPTVTYPNHTTLLTGVR